MTSDLIPQKKWISGVSDIAFHLFSFPIRWYSIFLWLAFTTAILLTVFKIWKFYKIPKEPILYIVPIIVCLGPFLAMIWSKVITHDFSNISFFNIQGLAIQGGVAFTILLSVIIINIFLSSKNFKIKNVYNSKQFLTKISSLLYFDAAIPTILIGQAIGRWGNYFNQEIYGAVVTSQQLKQFLHDHLPYMYIAQQQAYCQPLFLWESIINFCGFLIIYFGIEFIKKRKAGDLGFLYFVWYGIVRCILEKYRDSQFTYFETFIMSYCWIAFGVIAIVLNHIFAKKIRQIKIWFSIKNLLKYLNENNKYFCHKIKHLLNKKKYPLYEMKKIKIIIKRSFEEQVYYGDK